MFSSNEMSRVGGMGTETKSMYIVLLILSVFVLGYQNCARIEFEDITAALGDKQAPQSVVVVCPVSGGAENVSASIVGPKELDQGEVGTFNLPGLENCASTLAVSWFSSEDVGVAPGQEFPVSVGNSFRRGFGLPGVYLIVARVIDSSLQFKEITHQVLVREKCRSGTACNDEVGRSAIGGPSIGYVGDLYSFRVISTIPANLITWFYGSASAVGSGVISLSFRTPGLHEIRAEFRDSSGRLHTIRHTIMILDRLPVPGEGPCVGECESNPTPSPTPAAPPAPLCHLDRSAFSGPTVLGIKEKGFFSVHLPPCARGQVEGYTWDIETREEVGSDGFRTLSFDNPGIYLIRVRVRLGGDQSVREIELSRRVTVILEQCRIEVPNPTPPPTTPESCLPLKEGDAIEIILGISTSDVACGLDGTKTQRFERYITRKCVGGKIETSPVMERKVSESPCLGESCLLPGGAKLRSGQSVVRYSQIRPLDACSNHRVDVSCSNGKLSYTPPQQVMSSEGLYESCRSGCRGIGRDGDTTFVRDGEVNRPKQCPFGEEGYFEKYTNEKELKCLNGASVSTGVTRDGDFIERGQCPSYTWVEKGWTVCTANCGGEQQAIYTCRASNGKELDSAEAERRCGTRPTKSRFCNRNPDDSYQDTKITYLPGTAICPKNQIGVILTRVKTVSYYQCVNHKYEKVDEKSESTQEKYCKDYVAARCSHDSLSPSRALGRYAWMKKCEPKVPQIAEFFEKVKGVKDSPEEIFKATYKVDKNGRVSYGRMTYATFQYPDGKPWVAPAPGTSDHTKYEPLPDVSNISCEIPNGAAITAVCLSSCLTPEQSIMTDIQSGKSMGFLSALESRVDTVSSVRDGSSLEQMSYQQMKVDRFVTELLDSEHEILVVRTKAGREIRLTPNHPVLISTGHMVEAKELSMGTELVAKDGSADPIVSIEQDRHFGKVYNVFLGTSKPNENLVISQDLVIGTGFFQNEGAEKMNRMILRNRLTDGVEK